MPTPKFRHFSGSVAIPAVLLIPALLSAQPAPQPPAPAPSPAPIPSDPPRVEPAPAPPAPTPVTPPPITPAPTPVEPAPAPPPAEPLPAQPVPEPAAPSAPVVTAEPIEQHRGHEPPAGIELAEPRLRPVAPEQDALPWYDAIELRAFVDAYLGINYNFPKPQTGANVSRAFDTENGFALAWAGFDATYPAEPVGGTISLRFGPSAERIGSSCFSGTCDSEIGLGIVKQAYGSWRPGGAGSAVELSLGKFDTIYGAELAESQDNINYTRGLVYWYLQPLFHTGLRVSADLTEALTVRGLLVNGYNNTVDNNLGKDLGLQLALTLPRQSDGEALLVTSLGYLVGPERDDFKLVECGDMAHFDAAEANGCAAGAPEPGESSSGVVDRGSTNTKGLRHFVDLVVNLTPLPELGIVLNADLGVERVRDTVDEARFVQHVFWGGMLGARYAFSDSFALAGRGEYLADPDGFATGVGEEIKLVSGTLTLDYRPADFMLLRLDGRIDWSNKQIFPKSVRDFSGVLPSTTLGMVVTTN